MTTALVLAGLAGAFTAGFAAGFALTVARLLQPRHVRRWLT